MSTDSSSPQSDANLSGLGRLLLGTNEGSKPSSGPWVPPTAEELHAILPQYEIVKMLGRGGMGAVYMGRQTALDRPVAIKILSAQLEESDMGFTERFKNEARAMGKLNHPAIVSVYEFGQHESGLLYIVMEYVDGTDVAKMIAKSGRLHTEHAMAITAHVCDALAYAHERGIIHRDIKPANVMVDYDGSVKIADFGLAKVSTSNGSTLGLTQSGMAMGTLHFMAPEALMLGTAVDQRADIYAVGVMLYQMLTGKLPQGMFKMPSLQVPGLDPRYDGIIAKAMMEDRAARYQSARELRTDLDGILTQPVVKLEPASMGQAAALPTQARPQRPGGKPVMRQAAPVAPMQAPKTSLAWLWMTTLIVAVLGVVAWLVMDTQDKPVVASAPSSPANNTIPATPPAVAPPAKSSPAPVDDTSGWQSLFNGKDLTGWEASPPTFPAQVISGMLKIEGVAVREEAGHLFYVGQGSLAGQMPEWKNFELITKLKTLRMGNSGLRIHSRPISREININASGPEINIWNEGMTTQVDKDHRTGGVMRIAPVPDSHFKDGEWFEMRVKVENDKRLQVWVRLEGATTWNQTVDWTQPANWTPPQFNPHARLSSGTIAFTNWVPADGEVWLKEVKFHSLDPVTVPDTGSPDEKLILGRWTRTNMDQPGAAYLMDLSADGTALWTGDNTTVRGTWQIKSGLLEVDWNSRFKFAITLPAGASPAVLKGTANWPDGRTTEVVYERKQPETATATSAPTWTDTKGRSLQAKFIRTEGTNVLLDIAGKVTPVPLATLSPASQTLALKLGENVTSAVSSQLPPSYANRCTAEARMDRIRQNGGSAEIEQAVTKSLAWLKTQQNADGSWGRGNKVGITGFALQCFFARCETTDSAEYGDAIVKALMFLIEVSRRNPHGLITEKWEPKGGTGAYEHAIATTAIGEACILAKDGPNLLPGLRETFTAAVQAIIDNQNKRGSWTYGGDLIVYKNDSTGEDLSLSNWHFQALRVARDSGLKLADLDLCISQAVDYIASKQTKDGGFGGTKRDAHYNQWYLSGGAIVGLQTLTVGDKNAEIRQGVKFLRDFITAEPLNWGVNCNLYSWRHYTDAFFLAGGDDWRFYSSQLVPQILSAQQSDGSFMKGTADWPASGAVDAIYRQCLCTLQLEVFYRLAPRL